ncbi:MAG: alpha-galactosidase [Cytophagales bacterium]|nr:alpha-galactosidase [Cytophagales bacterium]
MNIKVNMKYGRFLFFGIIAVFNGCMHDAQSRRWSVVTDQSGIVIKAGILEQFIPLPGTDTTGSTIYVRGDKPVKFLDGDIAFTLKKARPNKEPEGIRYNAESSSDKPERILWTDSIRVFKNRIAGMKGDRRFRISEPQDDIKRVTVTCFSKDIKIFLEINYEIYREHPVVRKWVEIKNQSDRWYKISDLVLQRLELSGGTPKTTLLTPASREIAPSVVAFSDSAASSGLIVANEIPSKLRELSTDGTNGYNPEYFEWVIGPGEYFRSEPVFTYAFSGESFPTLSAVSTSLDRAVETAFRVFMDEYILKQVKKNIAPVFCTWTNYNANINEDNMYKAVDIAMQMGFKCFQIDAGWSDTGDGDGWAITNPRPDTDRFGNLKKLNKYILSKNMLPGIWYSVFMNEPRLNKPVPEPVLFSLPEVKRDGGLGLSFCYDKSREKYVNDLVTLNKEFYAGYYKQDLSNICYGDFAYGHESRTLKESYLRGLRGLFQTQDRIHEHAPDAWLQLSHEIYWRTPGPPCDIAVLKYADSYHTAPNEYWGAGDRKKLVDPSFKFNTDDIIEALLTGAFRARKLLYAHRALPLSRIEVFGAVTTNINGSLTPEIIDRQICSWLMGAPISFSGDLTSLTPGNVAQYRNRFRMLDNLQRRYGIYRSFQFSGVPEPTDTDWHWWGKLNGEGCGVVIVLRGGQGEAHNKINIPWVNAEATYKLRTLFAGKEIGTYTGKELQQGKVRLALNKFGQEIIEVSAN